jgi:hypothetical protein
LPDLADVPLQPPLRFRAAWFRENDEDDEDFVPEEEEQFGEEDEEETIKALAHVLEDEASGGLGDQNLRSQRRDIPRRQIRAYTDLTQVEGVFAGFKVGQPRGFFADLGRRFDVPKTTLRHWFAQWVVDPTWRGYYPVFPGNRRLVSDDVER